MLLTVLLYLFAFVPQKPHGFFGKFYAKLFSVWCKVACAILNVKVTYVQRQGKPLPQHCIIITNHSSLIDFFAVSAYYSPIFLVNKQMGEYPILGRIFKAKKMVFFERGDSDSAKAGYKKLSELITEYTVCIAPEGRCHHDVTLPFYSGAFKLSKESGAPITALYMDYYGLEDYAWKDESVFKKAIQVLLSNSKEVKIYIKAIINPQDFTTVDDMRQHAEQLYLEWQRQHRQN